MNSRWRISLVMMMLSILLLAAFQAWWIRNSYREERETLNILTSVAFKETLLRLQAASLRLDSNNFKVPMRTGERPVVQVFTDTLRESVHVLASRRKPILNDSMRKQPERNSTMIVSVDQQVNLGQDSGRTYFRRTHGQLFDVLLASDSAGDSLRISDIDSIFSRSLKQQGISVSYEIKKTSQERLPIRVRQQEALPGSEGAKISMGFFQPMTYQLQLGNTFPYLVARIIPQLLFAVFLLAVTIISFLILYRSLMAQRKLAGIKNDFISNITHELKTPIATVSVAIEALKNFNAIEDPQKTREYLDISQNELHRLSLLVDKVLKLSMFENKVIELKPELVSMRSIIEEVVSSMRLQFDKYHAQISVFAESDAMVRGDKLHLTSVIFNLLDNALKYSQANPSIRVEARERDGNVEVVVIDNGIGIAPEYREKIFEKFFRIPSGDTHNAKGYGLGLSYVSHIVQKHNGSIEVESQPGIGSRFTVKLPQA